MSLCIALQQSSLGGSEAGPETLQGESGVQQMVNFIAPCKSALPVSPGSSAVQGDCTA